MVVCNKITYFRYAAVYFIHPNVVPSVFRAFAGSGESVVTSAGPFPCRNSLPTELVGTGLGIERVLVLYLCNSGKIDLMSSNANPQSQFRDIRNAKFDIDVM